MITKYLAIAIVLAMMVLLVDQTQSFQNNWRALKNSKITETTHGGLRAFVTFTSQQIIIINNNVFDWTNVRVSLRTGASSKGIPSELLSASESARTLPRVKARSVYTVSLPQLPQSTSSGVGEVAMHPLSLEIQCDTPQGRSFWIGRWE